MATAGRMPSDVVEQELEQVRSGNPDGMLIPAEVVRFARDPGTALHTKFTWDDGDAAERWRIHEAQQVIRVHVTVLKEDTPPVRAYVSLPSDRVNGNGYCRMEDVVASPHKLQCLVDQAKHELNSFRVKYEHLSQLEKVFRAIDEL